MTIMGFGADEFCKQTSAILDIFAIGTISYSIGTLPLSIIPAVHVMSVKIGFMVNQRVAYWLSACINL